MNKFSKILYLALFGLFMTTGLSAQEDVHQSTKQILSKECAQSFRSHVKNGQVINFMVTDDGTAQKSKVTFLPDGRLQFDHQSTGARVNGPTFKLSYNENSSVVTISTKEGQQIAQYKVVGKPGGLNEIQCM